MRRRLKEEEKYNSYILFISVRKNLFLKIGRLGMLKFGKGKYIYVGSARRGMEKRIRRHLRRNKNLFWHIDYLTICPEVRIFKVGISDIQECQLAEFFQKSLQPVPGFGSSDCKCKGHLFRCQKELQLPEGVKIWQ